MIAAGIVALVGGTSATLFFLKAAPPTIDRTSVWIDTVKRGDMTRAVRGTGNLVSEEFRWICAGADGRVERIFAQPGTLLRPDTPIMELANPQLEQEALVVQWEVQAAEAELARAEVRSRDELLQCEEAIARAEADHREKQNDLDVNRKLFAGGIIAELELKQSQVQADLSARTLQIAQQRLKNLRDSLDAQLRSARATLEQKRAAYQLKREQLQGLFVTAQTEGTLQQVMVQIGQRVSPGASLAAVSDPRRLKAVLRIPETQARDVVVGQPVIVDTRAGTVTGQVSRIDPAAQEGTVLVDVRLTGDLPRGARPALSVDGTIEIEKLENVLYVGRPADARAAAAAGGSRMLLYRVRPDGQAERVPVYLGRGSVTTVEVVDGLQEGDQVILSGMLALGEAQRVRIR